jgi:hypothetical protein
MRTALALMAAAVVVFFAGWAVDDKVFGDDIPRSRSVAGVPIGGLSIEDAEARLAAADLSDRSMALTFRGQELYTSIGELGVVIGLEAALEAAAERPDLLSQPFSWFSSLFNSNDHDPVYSLDSGALGTFLATDGDEFFTLDFGRPRIELINGEFVEADPISTPVVDIAELEQRIIEAVLTTDGLAFVEIPIGGESAVDRGAAELIKNATELTENGLLVVITGNLRRRLIPEGALRSWIVFGGTTDEPTITLDDALVQSTLETLFIDFGDGGTEATFWIDQDDEVHIRGNIPGTVCCAIDSSDRILAALESGADEVELTPRDEPDVRGIAWAESLGIREIVGEFTTNYVPNETRVINIQRIAQITQGVVIEPGEMFSVNEYVGVRTEAKGFVEAGVIQDGVFQTSVGGGISQYATTLFNAAFFAGLDFGEYQAHSIYISRYPYGREATVSYPHPDLQIINNTPYGVLLWPTTDHDSITVKLFSTRWVESEQTKQTERLEGSSCTRVTTERTRTWSDGSIEVDSVTARYRPEGMRCDGSPSLPEDETTTTTTTTTVPPSTTVP